MKSERLQILSLAYTGDLAQEEAESRLATLGRRERRMFQLVLAASTLGLLLTVMIVFHLEDKTRFVANSVFRNLEGSTVFREVDIFLRKIFGS